MGFFRHGRSKVSESAQAKKNGGAGIQRVGVLGLVAYVVLRVGCFWVYLSTDGYGGKDE